MAIRKYKLEIGHTGFLLAGISGIFLVAAPLARAGDWNTGYAVSAQEVYTDNICLNDDGKTDEWVTTVTPSININGSGGRSQLKLSGLVEFNDLSARDCGGGSGDKPDHVNPRLTADGNLEVYRSALFVDASSRIQQNRANPDRASGDTNLNLNGNTNTTYSHTISPYLQREVAGLALVNLRYTYNTQTNSANSVDDSDEEAVVLSLGSIADGTPFTWGVSGTYREITYDDDNNGSNLNDRLATVVATAGYRVSNQLQLVGSAGEDLNDFEVVGSDQEVDGSRWSAGFIYQPNSRTQIHVEKGEQFFGDSSSVDIEYRHKHSRFSFNYSESLTLSRDLRLEEFDFLVVDENGNPFLDQNGQPIYLTQAQVVDTRSPIIDERYRAGYTWSRGRTTLSFIGAHSVREELADSSIREYDTFSVAADRRVSPKTNITARCSYSRNKEGQNTPREGFESEQRSLNLGLRHSLGRRTDLNLNVSRSERMSDDSNDEYVQHRFSVGVTARW
ncbi:TIGR03016 family PEP-CTERM system-associated outer membrane protein [Pseudomaricurvus sp. HS19]|nr:TIGR03016 family PEP-CTERM system-associated outer membrane protein [Pseudomaricurvus sp. HS19]